MYPHKEIYGLYLVSLKQWEYTVPIHLGVYGFANDFFSFFKTHPVKHFVFTTHQRLQEFTTCNVRFYRADEGGFEAAADTQQGGRDILKCRTQSAQMHR